MRNLERWSQVDWRKEKRSLRVLQHCQNQAVRAGDWSRTNRLRNLIRKSRSARLIAVKKVTQENDGRRTPGVDGLANLSDDQKLALARDLGRSRCGLPYRAAHIRKTNGQRRLLHIPSIYDRAAQQLFKLSIEQEFCHKIHPDLIGGRSGKGLYDALETVIRYLHGGPKYAARADIQDFFPSVSWEVVRASVHLSAAEERQLRAWLAAPTRQRDGSLAQTQGVPQGSAIATLLAHATLGGLHEYVLEPFEGDEVPLLLVYVDDIVILAEQECDVLLALARLKEWLEGRGYRLNPQKTTLLNGQAARRTAELVPDGGGFEFLGVRFEHLPEDPELVDLGPEGWCQYPPEIAEARAQTLKWPSGWETHVTVLKKKGHEYAAVDPSELQKRVKGLAYVTKEGSDYFWR